MPANLVGRCYYLHKHNTHTWASTVCRLDVYKSTRSPCVRQPSYKGCNCVTHHTYPVLTAAADLVKNVFWQEIVGETIRVLSKVEISHA